MNTRYILIALCLVGLAGCASTPMTVPSTRTLVEIPEDGARLVFIRSSFVGNPIAASLYDVTDGDPVFIGVIENKNRIAYSTQPGHRVFMVVSEAADFLEADLLEGKTYYSIVTPRMGAWKARFSLWPVRADGTGKFNTNSDDFKSWMRETRLVEQTSDAHRWYEQNKSSVLAKQAKYWPAWQQKSPADLAERTLKPEDGM